MIFEVIYRNKAAGDKKKRSLFLEKSSLPERAEVIDLLTRATEGNFEEQSIEVQECSPIDIRVLRNLEIPVHRLNAAGQQAHG
ncbi:MAG TPA: hypothetical protein VNN77_16275 [candidate division Zixibacteria bacterium]|nr:hypothetical protein [candidate division Zixibacteria bacterium]